MLHWFKWIIQTQGYETVFLKQGKYLRPIIFLYLLSTVFVAKKSKEVSVTETASRKISVISR